MPVVYPPPPQSHHQHHHQQTSISTEAAVSEALLTLSTSSRPAKEQKQEQDQQQQEQGHALVTPKAQNTRNGPPPSSSHGLKTPLPPRPVSSSSSMLSLARLASRKPSLASANDDHEEATEPATKKARTVSPAPLYDNTALSQKPQGPYSQLMSTNHQDTGGVDASCFCPVCNRKIKGLGEHALDWSQVVQGRQRAKTITSIKKHTKEYHEHEPIWNVIVNSLDGSSPTSGGKASSSGNSSVDGNANGNSRVVTAPVFVAQALKKAALEQIPNTADKLRSFRVTEKMIDQRVGIAKGFIQFGGMEFLRNKECQDETGHKINPKSLRNLAYSLLQSMYDELMQAWNRNRATLETAMAKASLGLLRNRFQLLFAAPDKWSESWYIAPSKYETPFVMSS